ncbi:NAD-dependent epimerase/dehydratase family protein [Microvirga puerhi]|uniref:NAD-dependent epimerase/dehydratase family protein n=1 Tax=Microvirga puerhi TaxID=2876078 RepID=A0ABS7VS86_9HYPH|nr:NAD-dependent epimerase/dehydratase family protein [Microvirga puerhi]MBZ6078423.1 NAD-dependent epimerase/dehydratase family protein [Microvirga puerhi]
MTSAIDIDYRPSDLSGMECLVLGGGGFLGINLCNRLVTCGASVTALGRSLAWPNALDPRVGWTLGHLDDIAPLKEAIRGRDVVFHLASSSIPTASNQNPLADLEANVRTTVQLLDVCRGNGVRKLIFASSGGAVYGRSETLPIPENSPTEPMSAYGISKLTSEKYLALYRHLHGLDYQILRVANAYGRYQVPHRGQGVVTTMISRALSGKPLEVWGTGHAVRDFVHVDDVVAAMIKACFYTGPCKIMNVGSGSGLSINQLCYDIETILARGPLLRTYKATQTNGVPANILDTSLIKRELSWQPRVSWLAGLRHTVHWMAEATQPRIRATSGGERIIRSNEERPAAFATQRG